MLKQASEQWTPADSKQLYEVDSWGKGHFSVGENGNLFVHPFADPKHAGDLKELADRILQRGVQFPVLIRFNDILDHRITLIHQAFQSAIQDCSYQGEYCCVYPIKVNQQRQVVEEIHRAGKKFGFGLEAGSKPELLAVIAIADNETPIVCNGFKDSQFIETTLLAQKMGRQIITVVEKWNELELIIKHARQIGIRPRIGMRVKLAAPGSGRWQMSGGYKSKFGLTVVEVLRAVALLESHDMADCFELLHFHLGSQITDIRHVKGALVEATRIYADLAQRGTGLQYLDIGGGLGVDYDGSQTSSESSMNYTMQEYANDVIHHIGSVCDEMQVAHPTVISESGRAITAYHAALLFQVMGTSRQGEAVQDLEVELNDETPAPIRDLQDTLENCQHRNILEVFHDAQQSFDMAASAFATGMIDLQQRGEAESLYWRICHRVRELSRRLDSVPEELEQLDSLLAETYFCNFSLFQSLPDSWAIRQLFPIMPIHRLEEKPDQRAILGDVTCDSDGKIDRFVSCREQKRTLRVHETNGEPYYIGAFLAGAYQEILGDLHNLFGDTNAVHVSFSETRGFKLDRIIKGDSVSDVLGYVQFKSAELIEKMQAAVETAVDDDSIDNQQAGRLMEFYEKGMQGSTYLS